MKYILTPQEMRLCDSTAIEKLNIPSIILMENAARSAADFIRKDLIVSGAAPKIAIFCGSGNNGGDGFALARHLCEHCDVTIYYIGDTEKMSRETFTNFESASCIGINMVKISEEEDFVLINVDFDIVIDALIGVGGSENLHGLVVPLLKLMNSIDAVKLAIDVPTGLHSLTGVAPDACFLPDHTVTMFATKTGMLINDGPEVCGEICEAELGAPAFILKGASRTFAIESTDMQVLMPRRKRKTSKFDYGKVALIAGSYFYPGAGALCANSAISAGAGLVHLLTSKLHPALFPEVIPHVNLNRGGLEYGIEFIENAMNLISKCDSIAIGSGIGSNPNTLQAMREIIFKLPVSIPVVIDADGLKAIVAEDSLSKNVILTPHIGEMALLTGEKREVIAADALQFAKDWAKKLNCIILLKHTPTIITDGESTYLNLNGNPGMATAGSGDVLTGIIATLCAQKKKPLEAAALGAFIHASAGDYFSERYSETGLTASGLIESLKFVM